MIEQHQLEAERAIAEALQTYRTKQAEEHPEWSDDGVIIDFVCGFTVQRIDEEGDLTWQNNWIAKSGVGPNAHAGLTDWLADRTSAAYLEDDIRDDE